MSIRKWLTTRVVAVTLLRSEPCTDRRIVLGEQHLKFSKLFFESLSNINVGDWLF